MHAFQIKPRSDSFQTEIDGEFVLVTYTKSWDDSPRFLGGHHDDYDVDDVRVWTLDGDVELEPDAETMAQIEGEAYRHANRGSDDHG